MLLLNKLEIYMHPSEHFNFLFKYFKEQLSNTDLSKFVLLSPTQQTSLRESS